MNTRIEKLDERFFVLYLDVGNLPKIKADEYCMEMMGRVKETQRQEERFLIIPIRNQDPAPIVQVVEREQKGGTITIGMVVLIFSILSFCAIVF